MTQLHYIYTYTYKPGEYDLSRLEMRSLFGFDVESNILKSPIKIEPSRSPFMKERLDVLFEASTVEQLAEMASALHLGDKTFKITCLNSLALGKHDKLPLKERNAVMRTIGMAIEAEPDFTNPQIEYAIVLYKNMWHFGQLVHGESVWLHHQQKPEMYSTALNTRDARAIANIAAPQPDGLRVIDPCCGIGTVLVEAMSMGIDIEGRDMNKLVVFGSRTNLRHFGYEPKVEIGPIAEAPAGYDVAIIDMPYNLFTHITVDLQQNIITEARRIAKKVVIVTIETMDDMIDQAGFIIVDRAVVKKGTFERQVLVCE